MKIVWSPVALNRVEEIADYIAKSSLDAARTWTIDVFAATDILTSFPDSGRVVPEAGRSNIREIIFKSYRIVYRVEPKQISVLTVRHSRQRLRKKEFK